MRMAMAWNKITLSLGNGIAGQRTTLRTSEERARQGIGWVGSFSKANESIRTTSRLTYGSMWVA
jgi:hypothetical protein